MLQREHKVFSMSTSSHSPLTCISIHNLICYYRGINNLPSLHIGISHQTGNLSHHLFKTETEEQGSWERKQFQFGGTKFEGMEVKRNRKLKSILLIRRNAFDRGNE